ncbi:hypothetical protein ScPMuIL_016935 [Solemya velum]
MASPEDIINPQGVVVDRKEMTWDGDKFLSHFFTLPSIPVIGNWSVTAGYVNGLTTETTVGFEVKEYVLPAFSVKVVTERSYILPSDDDFRINFEAKYVYGRVVQGSVTYEVSLLLDGHVIPFIKEYSELTDGSHGRIIKAHSIRMANGDMGFPDGARLDIKASVRETATGKEEKIHDRNIVLLNTPYQILFTQSQEYFKPGMKYFLHVYVLLYGTDIPLTQLPFALKISWKRQGFPTVDEIRERSTDNDGVYTAEIDTGPHHDELEFEITTHGPGLEADQQAVAVLTISSYVSPSDSFLAVSTMPKLEVGETLSASTMNRESGKIEKINFLVVSRGHIVDHASSRQNLDNIGMTTTVDINVSPKMVPSGRVVAFYIRDQTNRPEVVADSVWFDVVDTCDRANVDISSMEGNQLSPKDQIRMKIKGSPETRVGLLAVDQAVYLLNNRHTLKHQSIFNAMEEHDLGCGFGGGRDRHDVFTEAGLAVITNADLTTPKRDSMTCSRAHQRKKRSSENLLRQNHICCRKGFDLGMDLRNLTTCLEERLTILNATDRFCARMFYQCCKKAVKRTKEEADATISTGSGRSGVKDIQLSFDDIAIEEGELTIRQVFPESWMFQEVNIGVNGEVTQVVTLPDSITTWVFQAVGVSKEHGVCVAKPENVTAFKDFFISLDMPYSAVRMEQMEVRATIFNYRNRKLPVRIYMKGTKGICSSARPGENSPSVKVYVEPNDAYMVKFPVVPLEAGSFSIDVLAISAGASDWIRKELHVRSEGKEVRKTVSFWLDPQCTKNREEAVNGKVVKTVCRGGENREYGEVDMQLPVKAIPGSEKAQARVIGNIMESAVTDVIAGHTLERWLRQPKGCGEQTMIYTAPIVSTMMYLHQTNQITPAIEKKGHDMIIDGINRELIYRKEDGSFSVWTHKPSSTWLTAFVMKIFCQAKNFVHVDDKNAICSGVEWLTSQQTGEGQFIEAYWVHHKEMIGGVNGDASMTAFVLISLLECDCRPGGTAEKIQLSISYLENQLQNMDRPLSVAITAYALALADSPRKMEANDKLRSLAQTDEMGSHFWSHADNFANQIRPYWHKNNPSALDVETTAYALLAQLELNEIQYSASIVEWLLKMRSSGGAFVSTQDTVVALQALSEYNVRTYAAEIDMQTTLRSESKAEFERRIKLQQDTALVQKTVENIPIGGKLFVDTTGSGLGRMEIEVWYNVNQTDEELCKFDVDINVEPIIPSVEDLKNRDDVFCDVCNKCVPASLKKPKQDDFYDYWQEFPANFYDQQQQSEMEQKMQQIPEIRLGGMEDEEVNRLGRSKRSRGVREADVNGNIVVKDTASKKTVCITAAVRHRGNKVINMAIVDIGLPTGYEADVRNLVKLEEDGTIDSFEITDRSIIMYLETIPSDESVILKFTASEEYQVGNRQAAQVHVYDYYDPSEQCVSFYSPTGPGDGDIDVMCTNNVCHCAESVCMKCWSGALLTQVTFSQLRRTACQTVDYVMSVKITHEETENKFTHYTAKVIKVHKDGIEELMQDDAIHFWQATRCVDNCKQVEVGKTYFIMGMDGVKYKEDDGSDRYKYFLDDRTFLTEDLTLLRSAGNTRVKVLLRQIQNFLRKGCRN